MSVSIVLLTMFSINRLLNPEAWSVLGSLLILKNYFLVGVVNKYPIIVHQRSGRTFRRDLVHMTAWGSGDKRPFSSWRQTASTSKIFAGALEKLEAQDHFLCGMRNLLKTMFTKQTLTLTYWLFYFPTPFKSELVFYASLWITLPTKTKNQNCPKDLKFFQDLTNE